MNKKDASIIKILAELNSDKNDELSEDDEYAWKYATDADFRFAEDVKRAFDTTQPTEKK